MSEMIKFGRTRPGAPDDYGKKFTQFLNKSVGGKKEWKPDEWPHGIALTSDQSLRVKRCEDGPEFYLNLANTFAACGSFLVSAMTLWFTVPRREKQIDGERFVEIRSPGLRVRIDCTNVKKAERRFKRIVKALK